jgi:hypothetical protein
MFEQYNNEIIDVIQILDPNKATGPDKISHKMLKISPEKIAKPLLIIFNKSLQQSKYPSNWKSAHVVAIFKKGDTSLPSNYRPISLISCVGKLMERIVYKTKQLNSFFFLESLGSNCIVLIVDGQWNVLAKTPIGIYI